MDQSKKLRVRTTNAVMNFDGEEMAYKGHLLVLQSGNKAWLPPPKLLR